MGEKKISKTKPGVGGVHDAQHLFHQTTRRQRRHLILPRLLEEEAARRNLPDTKREEAHRIILRWADMELKGQLNKKETSLDAQFLDEVFGTALGYKGPTDSPEKYHRERQFAVPGCGTVDGALGLFPPGQPDRAQAVIELKDALTDLDYDKSNGRTPVQQCWDYLYNLPTCPWGIVSNFVSFRLYHRDKTPQAFEHFTLQQLRDPEVFLRFYILFGREGLLQTPFIKEPPAQVLLNRSVSRQREVGDKLYDYYSEQRLLLIEHLIQQKKVNPDDAIRGAQKLLDRVIFIAFCEDRGLLPDKLIEQTWKNVPPLARATNPRWRNFLDVFHAIDKGHPSLDLATGYNGGLFQPDPNVDDLDLEDRWTQIFKEIGGYDFAQDVNVDVLGHFFERSITELEKLRTGGFFAAVADPQAPTPKMPKSAQRKRFGVYYTPPDFTTFIVEHVVGAVVNERIGALAREHGVDPDAPLPDRPSKAHAEFWKGCLNILQHLTICDPACGSGAFLIQTYDYLDDRYRAVVEAIAFHSGERAEALAAAIPEMILNDNLYGVDLSKEAVEITQLALWIRSARKGRTLADLSDNIVAGNSLVSDPNVHSQAMRWEETFPNIFRRKDGGFDCVVGNPPWERMKLQEREFFAFSAPDIAETANAADRRKRVAALEKRNPALWTSYNEAKAQAERNLNHVRKEGLYPLTGKGDINTYMLFAELARGIVRPTGRVGLLVPSGIATDHTTKEFFNDLVQSRTLSAVYDFVNRRGLFPDVEGRLKFCILLMNGREVRQDEMDFVFWAEQMKELSAKHRHIRLTASDLKLMNPNTVTCPIFRNARDVELTRKVYRRVPVLVDHSRESGGNPWGVRFLRMFDQTNDAEHFLTGKQLQERGCRLAGNVWVTGKNEYLPLFEAKMTRDYDHRATKVELSTGNWYMNYTAEPASLVEHQNPEFLPIGRWWVDAATVKEYASTSMAPAAIGFHDIARANDTRTMVACMIPYAAASNTVPLILNGAGLPWRRFCCLLGNLNSIPYDFIARQKVGGAHLNFFIVEQLPTLPPDAYDDKCPWNKRLTLETWISERVLKLTCTSNDMLPLAKATGFEGAVHKWKENERQELRAELDAAYFHLYGISHADIEYILSTFQGMTDDDGPKLEFSTGASLILEAFDRLGA